MTLPKRPTLSRYTLDAIAQLDLDDPDRHHQPPQPPEPPEYGTPEWRQLPDGDPTKLAAVFAAADRWNRLLDSPYAAATLAALYEWDDRRIYSEWGNTLSEYAREHHIEPGPSYEELERRRTQPGRLAEAWRYRHGSEHPGGPVAWIPEAPAAAA